MISFDMKKLHLIFCLLILIHTSFGQTTKLGFLAGINSSTFILQSDLYEHPSISPITGFHAGVFSQFAVGRFAIEPELLYSSIGGKDVFVSTHGAGGIAAYKHAVQYLQVPVNIIYNIPASFGKLFFGGGPYVGFSLSGKTAINSVAYDFNGYTYVDSYSRKYAFSNADNPDYGLNTTAGVSFSNKVVFKAGYRYGLKYLFYNGGLKNNVISISIGYAFLQ